MTVLRSRQILSAAKSLTPIKTLESTESIEPMTPSKSVEHSDPPSQITPHSDTSTPPSKPPRIRSRPDSGTAAPRRSLRLASARSAGEATPDDAVMGRDDAEVVENAGFEVGSSGVRVSDDLTGDGVEKGVDEEKKKKMLVDLNVVDLVSEDEKPVVGELSVLEGFNQAIGKVVSEAKRWGKRKLGDGDDGLVSGEKRYLNLRSGKKLSKRRMNSYDSFMDGNEDGRMLKTEIAEGKLKVDYNGDISVGTDSLTEENEASKGPSAKEKGKQILVDTELSLNCNAGNVDMAEDEKLPIVFGDHSAKGRTSRRRFSSREKGKGKLDEDVSLGAHFSPVALEAETGDPQGTPGSTVPNLADNVQVVDERSNVGSDRSSRDRDRRQRREERHRDFARRNASRFAHFPSEEVDDVPAIDEAENDMPRTEQITEMEDWPGPFSTAMKIIKDRQKAGKGPQQSSFLDISKPAAVPWVPKSNPHPDLPVVSAPLLQDLCMDILAKNADAITSLDCVPDVLRHKLCQLLCDTRRMNHHFLNLLLQGSPTEIRVRDCSWLTEEQFTEAFEVCETNNLTVLQLDQCGRCMTESVVLATIGRSPNQFPVLSTMSLKGACRLSDAGLGALVAAAPVLRSINLGQCSLLTSDGISTLADSLGSVLRELYLDDCQNIDPALILPALSKLVNLEVLSLAGIQTVSDDFVSKFIAICGHSIKEIVLADCGKLTDFSLKVITENCNGLHALDLSNLSRLTDCAMGYLANGCRQIEKLKLCRNPFSDEAVAAYLEASGESLTELSLNNVTKVGHNTAISLARRSKKLSILDLSWCRSITNEALGLMVDSCLSLKVVKLFGCTQITDVFLQGHSNAQVKIIGLKMTPILQHLKMPDPLAGPLHYSAVSSS